ncbi:MAG: Clp protease N-terminal domain-containing protein [Candidatus Dormibacteria bacterium]
MYPFERFTEQAKKVLTLAQQEAERSHHSYIGTEHLLLGLLRQEEGIAAKALHHLGLEIGAVRSTIDSVLGRSERLMIQQIIPTTRVKKVIEIAFEEARRMGTTYVGTEHLLVGLLIEGDGIAAHVLDDLGASLDKVRGEIDRLHHEMPPESAAAAPQAGRSVLESSFGPPSHTVTSTFMPIPPGARFGRSSPYGAEEMGRAAQRLADEQHTVAGPEHVLLAALDADPLVGRMLAALGIDEAKIAELRRIATPPDRLVTMRQEYETRSAELAGSWQGTGPGAPAELAVLRGAAAQALRRLGAELADAERRWRVGEEPASGDPSPDEGAP